MSDWAQYPDTTQRETYPPAPSLGGNPNKEVSDAVLGAVANQHHASVIQEAAFRARQYQRRLHTRGLAAMREPDADVLPPSPSVPDDPALAEYKAAGWL